MASSQIEISSVDNSPIQSLHHPEQAAHVQLPQAPLGNATNASSLLSAPGLGSKALLSKKIDGNNPSYHSPTDNLMTPCSAKLNQAKKKHFGRTKAVQLFATSAPTVLEPTTAEVDENKVDFE